MEYNSGGDLPFDVKLGYLDAAANCALKSVYLRFPKLQHRDEGSLKEWLGRHQGGKVGGIKSKNILIVLGRFHPMCAALANGISETNRANCKVVDKD